MTAKIKLNAASGGGSFSIQAPSSSNNNRVFTLPDSADATLLTSTTSTGKILQVIQAVKTDSQSFTSSSSGDDRFDIIGLSLAITPSSSSSKILITYSVHTASPNGGYRSFLHLMRGSTDIFRGDDANSRTRCSNFIYSRNDQVGNVPSYIGSGTFLDSPSTTSATTYKIQIQTHNSGGNVYYVNTASSNPSSSSGQNPPSQITVMEVAA